MPSHYGGKGKKKGGGKKKSSMKPMTDSEHKMFNEAVKKGLITQKQHDSLPPNLLKGIIKKKKASKK